MVAATATVVASVALIVGVVAQTPRVFEVLAAGGALVGVGVAFGAFDRAPFGARRTRPGPPPPPVALSAQVAAQLDALDPVEHRCLDLGSPWPTVVVGPTGVRVVTVAGGPDGVTVRALTEMAAEVRRLVAADLAVTGVLVVPAGVERRDHGAIQVVGEERLADVFARGALVPMPVVVRVFTHLSRSLATDLPERTAS